MTTDDLTGHTTALAEGAKSRRTALLSAAALALSGALRGLGVPDQVRAATTLKRAYQCAPPRESGAQFSPTFRVAQRFKARRSGTLRQITVAILKTSAGGDWTLQLVRVGDDGVPSSDPRDVLAAVTIPDGQVPNGRSTLKGAFVGTKLVKGTQYAAVVSRQEVPGSTGGALGLGFRDGGACRGLQFTASADEFMPDDESDLVLSVLVA